MQLISAANEAGSENLFWERAMHVIKRETVNQVEVFEFLRENRDLKYSCSRLAVKFETYPSMMRYVLKRLVDAGKIKCTVVGTNRVFYVGQEEIPSGRPVMPFKPLSQGLIKALHSAHLCANGR